ncbi:MAG: RsmB/NOP family class I SAM-dependent RNA methyltransferase [Marinicaulis sp.]|nr:RsmB/NOP family class I SAM-dependent RNA methyltransferase [Marinicaulis sp.]
MRLSGRLSAAIEILEDFEARRVPLKTAIADWGRSNRYAGAKDRAWISGLCLDVLRRKHWLTHAMQDDNPRALVFAAARFLWEMSVDKLTEAAVEEPHGPGALSNIERNAFNSTPLIPAKGEIPASHEMDPRFRGERRRAGAGDSFLVVDHHILGDYPEWLTPKITRVLGDNAGAIMAGFAERADVDLRVNTLKTTPEKALAALKTVQGEAAPILKTAARIAAPVPSQKAPAVTVIPAFNKGWVEVQDLGSQIAAAAAGDIKGAQVLDYCAGGGGKTLALGAMMENTGQLYAYDCDARRLKPLYHRAKRSGLRNLQFINPQTDKEALSALEGKMDIVFVDAPCTGSGTWRRHPDTKWRLTEKQLQTRLGEQDQVLREASQYVKPGGRMVWVTCSFLMEENEDRLEAFFADNPEFSRTPAVDSIMASGLLNDDTIVELRACETVDGALRLTPDKIRADGFFIAVLQYR